MSAENGSKLLVILDDDEERIAQMRAALSSIGADIVVRHFDNAPELLLALPELVAVASLISLDHDLGPVRYPHGERFDPGVGRAISEALAELPPTCPVIVHTSNAPAGQGMLNDLDFAGWQTIRVVPHSDVKWIAADWLPVVARVLGGAG